MLLARLPVALAHQDTWYPFEMHSGSIACALLDGLDLDLEHLPIVPHVRGSALFGALAVPLYAVAGASTLTLKLLPILWHAGTAALLVALLARAGARRAAWCAGALLVFAPPMLQKLSTVGLASHLESSLVYLSAWGVFAAWMRSGPSRGRAAALGALVGFAGFFHLQALLPSLLVLGLLVAHERRRLLSRHGLWLAGAALVCAAPAFLFDSGAVVLLVSGVFTESGGPSPGLGERLGKLTGLFTGDLAAALEFGATAPPLGAWLGSLAALGLGLGALAGLATLRRPPRTALFFALHAALVAGLYAVSNLEVARDVGAGAANRHLAPLVLSLLVLTALGAQAGRVGLVPVLLLAAVGAAGYPAVVRGSQASRAPQRGECYEWFTRQLEHGAGRDAADLAALLERVDRGDARFRTLRYPFAVDGAAAQADELLASGLAPELVEQDEPDTAALLRWTASGRALSPRLDEFVATVGAGRTAGLRGTAREALLHGVGLGLLPPRAVGGIQHVHAFIARLGGWLAALPADDARALAEGYGVQLGLVFDPYNTNMAEVVRLHRALDGESGAAFARGLAWGARQRAPTPPVTVPRGLVLAGCVDPRFAAEFEAAWCGRVLPREAHAFGR
ncbi:MAG TPA: hypothetical protein VMT18_12190 [Planctomycetota bacterium]|nr:hypothetical protein [Planctomycetota bacterium]